MSHAAAKASAVNVFNITGACRNCLPAFSRNEVEKTFDRSLRRFIEIYKDKV